MKFYARSVPLLIGLAMTVLVTSNCTIAQTKSSTKKPARTVATTKKVALAMTVTDDDSIVPDIKASTTYEYKCELNNSLIIYTHQHDDNRAALRWKNKLYGLKRIETTTGANRFENKKAGLVWIGIPTKGMLLDSIRGHQLANECKTANQLN